MRGVSIKQEVSAKMECDYLLGGRENTVFFSKLNSLPPPLSLSLSLSPHSSSWGMGNEGEEQTENIFVLNKKAQLALSHFLRKYMRQISLRNMDSCFVVENEDMNVKDIYKAYCMEDRKAPVKCFENTCTQI